MAHEQQTVSFAVKDGEAALDAALLEVMRRTMKGWKLTGYALTFERPVAVEVTARRAGDSPTRSS